MGDASAVVPVSKKDAVEVGQGQGVVARVLGFKEKAILEAFRAMEWDTMEVKEVYEFLHSLKQAATAEPIAVRARQLPQTVHWEHRYPRWFVPFQAGQLFVNLHTWERVFTQHGEVLPGTLRKWIRQGYSVWLQISKLGKQARVHMLTAEELVFAQKQAREWVDMGALEEVAKPSPHVRVCNIVVAYRAGVMDRVCWAGNAINKGVPASTFRMESLKAVVRLMRQGDIMFSFDLKKGYFQIPLKPAFKEFAYMQIGDQFYRWNVLMFGLASAPKDFSFVIKKVLGLLRKRGIRCSFFIDDIIFFAPSQEQALAVRKEALDLFYELGFIVSWPKSLLEPGTIIRHLGLDVCSIDASVWAPEDKVMRVKELAVGLLQGCKQPVLGRAVATFVGVLGALRMAIPAALILSRGLMRSLAQLPVLYEQVVNERQWEVKDYDATVTLSPLAIAELRFWVEACWKLRGVRVKEVAQAVCFVDACPEGAGAVVARKLPGGSGETWRIEQLRGGAWEERVEESSTTFELLNIWNVVEEFKRTWAGNTIQICSDNVGSVFITGRGCMHNKCLHALSLGIWRLCWEWGISLCTQYIGGDGIIAAGADGLSRDSDYGDCRLQATVFARLWESWGPMDIDLFSSPTSRQRHPHTGDLLWAVSPYRCEKRAGIDGLTFSSSKVLFAFPPTAILPALIPRAVKLGLRVVVIVPVWVQAPWWPLVSGLRTISCGKVRHCVLAGEAGLRHPFGPTFETEVALNTELQAKALNL